MKFLAGIELDNDPETGAAGRAWVEKNWDRLDFVLGRRITCRRKPRCSTR